MKIKQFQEKKVAPVTSMSRAGSVPGWSYVATQRAPSTSRGLRAEIKIIITRGMILCLMSWQPKPVFMTKLFDLSSLFDLCTTLAKYWV